MCVKDEYEGTASRVHTVAQEKVNKHPMKVCVCVCVCVCVTWVQSVVYRPIM